MDSQDLEHFQQHQLTSKSQQTNGSQGGVFKWANISGVQEAVSGAMSGLSAYMGWVHANTSDHERPEEMKGEEMPHSVPGQGVAETETDIVSQSVCAKPHNQEAPTQNEDEPED